MSHERIKNNDPTQLKQMIIFLKAELIKYETMDSISEINELQQENNQLLTENEALVKQVAQLQQEEKFEEITEIPINWRPVNEQLEALANIVTESIHAHKRFEQKITDDYAIIEQLTKEVGDQAKKLQKREGEIVQLKKELMEKETIMKALQDDLTQLEKEKKQLSIQVNQIPPEAVQQMDRQMKEVMKTALTYKEELEDKLKLLAQIEAELMDRSHHGHSIE